METKKCQQCNKKFKVYSYRKNSAKFCSFACYWKNKIGKSSWNKGMKTGIVPKTAFKKGFRANKKGEFKKGMIPWNKGFIYSEDLRKKFSKVHMGKHCSPKTEFKSGEMAGEKSYTWKGDNVGYFGLHSWVRRELGKPKFCNHCGKIGEYIFKFRKNKLIRIWNIHWANKNHQYKRDLNDWVGLCVSCHKKYDLKLKNNKQTYVNQK